MNIVKSAAETLFNDEVKDLSMDITELGLDSLISNDIIKELPFVKIVYTISKTSMAVKEKFLLKKFLNFIKTFNECKANDKEIIKRKKAIENQEKWIYKEMEFFITYLDNMDSVKKAKIFAYLYNEYLNKRINWERFCQFTEITNRMFSYDIDRIAEFYSYSSPQIEQGLSYFDLTSYNRLVGLGLMEREIDCGQDMSKFGNVFREEIGRAHV